MKNQRDEGTGRQSTEGAVLRRLRRLTVQAWVTRLLESLVRALVPAAIVAADFVALSWTGIWLGVNGYGRVAGCLVFLVALAASLRPLARLSLPTRRQALEALDDGRPDAPAAVLDDALANQSDPLTRELWGLHRKRALRSAATLRCPPFAPRLWLTDTLAIGPLAILALCTTAMVAGPDRAHRLKAAFDWSLHFSAAPSSVRVDAWINPPVYTGKPPIYVALRAPGDGDGKKIDVPVGSLLAVQSAARDLTVARTGGIAIGPKPKKAMSPGTAPGLSEVDFVVIGDGVADVSADGKPMGGLGVHAVPDAAPTIRVVGEPQVDLHGKFTLNYEVADDYGATAATIRAVLALDPQVVARALVKPPSGPIELPSGGLGKGRSVLDWSDSPYGGARAALVLGVRDFIGNRGEAVVRDFVLPQKVFKNPVASALAGLRRALALDRDMRWPVANALDALMGDAKAAIPTPGAYLGIRFAMEALGSARNDGDLLAAADMLWEVALRIEDGAAPQAERDLKEAKEALRQAIDRGAPPEEIARLANQMRKAMDEYLAAIQEKRGAQPQQGDAESEADNTVSPEDVKSMLDQAAEAARNGDKESAKELLDKVQDILEAAMDSDRQQGSEKARKAARDRRDVDQMSRDQQGLNDETYAHERASRPRPEGQPAGENGGASQGPKAASKPGQKTPSRPAAKSDAAQREIMERQRQLQGKLDELRRKSDGEIKAFGDASDAMKKAGESLQQGDDESAMSAQAKALDGLRRGAGEQARKSSEEGEGEDGKKGGGKKGKGHKNGGKDGGGSYGRNQGGHPDGAAPGERSRQILDEIRSRLSNPGRPQEEIDYLQRLIKPE